jgi:hypothetical protein
MDFRELVEELIFLLLVQPLHRINNFDNCAHDGSIPQRLSRLNLPGAPKARTQADQPLNLSTSAYQRFSFPLFSVFFSPITSHQSLFTFPRLTSDFRLLTDDSASLRRVKA